MHELGIMQGALDTVIAEAGREGVARVLRVRMRIGALTGLVTESLEFAFEVLREGTVAGGAALDIESASAAYYCETCGREFEPPAFSRCCPVCGRVDCRVVKGFEIEVLSMEVE